MRRPPVPSVWLPSSGRGRAARGAGALGPCKGPQPLPQRPGESPKCFRLLHSITAAAWAAVEGQGRAQPGTDRPPRAPPPSHYCRTWPTGSPTRTGPLRARAALARSLSAGEPPPSEEGGGRAAPRAPCARRAVGGWGKAASTPRCGSRGCERQRQSCGRRQHARQLARARVMYGWVDAPVSPCVVVLC
jgi:hypothetical protein